jgi:hypothetical protein
VVIWFYISGHGFGHAARDIEILNALAALDPDLQVVVRTTAAPWFFHALRARFEIQPMDTDTGLAQLDSLRFDERETLAAASRFYADFDRRADTEAARHRHARPDLVAGDIPPLAFAAAARAGIRSVAIGNFTWDWIYAAYPAFAEHAPHVVPTIREAYAQAGSACRLPFHGGFEPMAAVTTDVPLVARRSGRDRGETRRRLAVGDDRPVVLASFGAYGAALPYAELSCTASFTLLHLGHVPPPHGLAYEDVVGAADVVVSKPGYGIVSDCIANDVALVYTSRGRFAEYDLFVAQMPRVLRCRFLPPEDLRAGRWEEAILAVLEQPAPAERWSVDGAAVVARHIQGRR